MNKKEIEKIKRHNKKQAMKILKIVVFISLSIWLVLTALDGAKWCKEHPEQWQQERISNGGR